MHENFPEVYKIMSSYEGNLLTIIYLQSTGINKQYLKKMQPSNIERQFLFNHVTQVNKLFAPFPLLS